MQVWHPAGCQDVRKAAASGHHEVFLGIQHEYVHAEGGGHKLQAAEDRTTAALGESRMKAALARAHMRSMR